MLRLVEDGGLLGVEVLGLRIGEHAAAERDAAPRLIVDRKHHAVVEAILQATATVNGKIAREHPSSNACRPRSQIHGPQGTSARTAGRRHGHEEASSSRKTALR